MITGSQIRAARGLLGWDAIDLAFKAGLTRETVSKIENDVVQAREKTLDRIIQTFAAYDVEFIPDEGVKKKSDSVTKLEGFENFKFFMDEVYEAATNPYSYDGTKPICICNLDNSLFRKYMKSYHAIHVERLKKLQGLKIRSLAAEADKNPVLGSTYLVYRYLKELKGVIAPFYVFSDKFALIDFDVPNAPRILLIHSAALAQSYRDQFNIMWKNALEEPPVVQ